MTNLTKIPVTVITGFLGAGKTTFIRHLMENAGSKRLAVLVNEFGTAGVDGDILKSCAIDNCPAENIVELANGCICCTSCIIRKCLMSYSNIICSSCICI